MSIMHKPIGDLVFLSFFFSFLSAVKTKIVGSIKELVPGGALDTNICLVCFVTPPSSM